MATKKPQSTTRIREWNSWAETSVFQHVNDGKTTYEQVNAVNGPARPTMTAKQSNLITRVRVITSVEEDKGVHLHENGASNYFKEIETVQERDGGVNNISQHSTPI